MSPIRRLVLLPFFAIVGCASAPERLASRECKVVVADFPGKPAQKVNRAEQAAAELHVSRLAVARGGYTSGSNLMADVARDCY